MTDVRPGSLRAWVVAARPATLSAAVVPVAVGTACAYAIGKFALWPALAACVGACLIQIGTNFANDAFDFDKGADTEARLGPVRAAQSGLLTSEALKRGVAVSFVLATAIGAYLTTVAGPVIVVIGLASLASGVAYTGGPFPLAYNGLGDAFVFVFFGFVAVCGTVFVQALGVPPVAWWSSVVVGALATAILVVNNIRDEQSDRVANKRTLVVRFGRRFGEAQYALLLLCAWSVPLGLWLGGLATPGVLLGWLLTPLAMKLLSDVRLETGVALNKTLVGTAKLLLLYGLLFAIGLCL